MDTKFAGICLIAMKYPINGIIVDITTNIIIHTNEESGIPSKEEKLNVNNVLNKETKSITAKNIVNGSFSGLISLVNFEEVNK